MVPDSLVVENPIVWAEVMMLGLNMPLLSS